MTALVLPMLHRLKQMTLVRYILASVGALAADMGSFLGLLKLDVPAVLASALGYSLGIIAHWLLSSRHVFSDQLASGGFDRARQKAMFVASALIGLALTTAIVGTASVNGIEPRLAKLCAIMISFTATWLLRKKVVFR